MGVLIAIALNDPVPPIRINTQVPQALSDLVMQLLDKEPNKRPASAQEVIAKIQQMLAGNGAAAGHPAPPLPSYPSMGGALRRQRWAVGREQRA